jgi:hypothetical protein
VVVVYTGVGVVSIGVDVGPTGVDVGPTGVEVTLMRMVVVPFQEKKCIN